MGAIARILHRVVTVENADLASVIRPQLANAFLIEDAESAVGISPTLEEAQRERRPPRRRLDLTVKEVAVARVK